MPEFNQDEFNTFTSENNVYGFFSEAITLKSGRKSHFYANWRNVVEDVYLTEILVNFVISFVRDNDIDVDTFYGVPEGATKLGILTQFFWAKNQDNYGKGSHALSMGRAKPKEHGAPKDRYFVGLPQGRVVLLEDVTTTGGSSLNSLDSLRDAGIDVVAVISLTNRMEKRNDGLSVKDAFAKRKVPFYNMSSALDLLPVVFNKVHDGEEIGLAIEAEFDKYGVSSIKLL
ncbi:MAG: hypothetical protein KAR42_02595 [candidate division Zixibacteria bacterium]|nr:hypothetical protein [candidate division Zixibacteria bacterium]